MTYAISLDRLSKTYSRSWLKKPVEALKNVTLTVNEGEVFGFVGANGAGKSTTIKILTGAMGQSGGSASLFGIPVGDASARQRVGYVPENPQLYDFLTPTEILKMGIALHGVKVDSVERHCQQWLDRFDLAKVAKRNVRTFSKGMTQRVALAHALAIQPRLLILDEPLSGLDPLGRKDVVDILEEFKNNGGSVFLTSHVLHDVERLADRFALIHHGEIKAIRSSAELIGAQHRVMVRSHGAIHVEGMESTGVNQWYGEVESDGLWKYLQMLESAGHQLIEVRPTLNLEAAFMEVVKGA